MSEGKAKESRKEISKEKKFKTDKDALSLMLLKMGDRAKVSATTLSDIMAEKVEMRSVVTLPSVIVGKMRKLATRILLSEENLRNFEPSLPVSPEDPDRERRGLKRSIADQRKQRENLVEKGLHYVAQGYQYNLVKFCLREWREVTEGCPAEQIQGDAASAEVQEKFEK